MTNSTNLTIASAGVGIFLKRVGAALLLASTLVSVSSADTLFGVHAGASIWRPDVGGSVGQPNNAFDISGEFADSTADSSTIYVAVEHFIPLIPNAMLKRTPLSWSGKSSSATGSLGGTTSLNGAIDAEFDLNMTDITLYYELLDNWVSLDVGLTARNLDGHFSAQEASVATVAGASDRVDVDGTIPMLYGHARFDLPFSGLAAVGLRGNIIGYEGNNLSDLEAYVHLEVELIPLVDVGIRGGLRRLSLDIDDLDGWNSDATMEGAFVGLTVHF